MLGELHWYIHQDPTPDNALMTSETLAYLEACHLLFEQGLLSHERIRSLDSDVLRNISKGYEYFSGWLTSILDKGSYMFIFWNMLIFFMLYLDPKYPHTAATQKSFLSWQSKCGTKMNF